jgi:SAM-dependent methyltransferase
MDKKGAALPESKSADMEIYLAGRALYGEDLSPSEVDEWLSSEEEGFANLGAKHRETYEYGYHAINNLHGFRHLGGRRFKHALGFGSAYGHELKPMIRRIDSISLLDASSSFVVSEVDGVPVRYIKASRSGDIALASASVDLVTCFGVLHHIPRVSHTLAEMHRVLQPGGVVLIREPITSMGDWRGTRPGLTRHERGIPFVLFSSMLRESGFGIRRAAPCFFPATDRLGRLLRRPLWDNPAAVRFDALLSLLFAWNHTYHRRTFLRKLAPGHAFWIAQKQGSPQ